MSLNNEKILMHCIRNNCHATHFQGDAGLFMLWISNQGYSAFVNETGLSLTLQQKTTSFPLEDKPGLPYSCFLELLGCHIWVRCRHEDCLQEILRHFSCSQSTKRMTPDVVVECDWEHAERYLFRSRPTPTDGVLEGVRVLVMGQETEGQPWNSAYPPLPPLNCPPFVNRFVGLHGAALTTPNGEALLLIGERGSGKSTLAIDFVNHADYSLLTDETIFIHNRTVLVEPFPIALGVKNSAEEHVKRLIPAVEAVHSVAKAPALATRIIILSPSLAEGTRLEKLNEVDGVRQLLTHHLDVGADMSESIVTLLQLANRCEITQFSYSRYEDLFSLRGMLDNPSCHL